MTAPLVSVIIPVCNGAQWIGRAIDSALMQKVPLEIIVIDDGSTDDLPSAMAQYVRTGSVKLLKNSCNLGVAETRNRGVRAAAGQYIAFLDADDFWAECKLQKQLDALRRTGDVLCCTARELIRPSGECTGRIIPVKESVTYKDLLHHNCISCSSVLIRREIALEFPMHHSDSHEDYIMWLEVLKKYGKACGINEPLLRYRLSSTGKSGSKLKSAKMTYTAYRYSGLSVLRSAVCFCSYAVHGVYKYLLSCHGGKQ